MVGLGNGRTTFVRGFAGVSGAREQDVKVTKQIAAWTAGVALACCLGIAPLALAVDEPPAAPTTVPAGPVVTSTPTDGSQPMDARVPVLGVGDAAPAVSVAEWVLGAPASDGPQRVRVVEFWATWCAPCRRSLATLTALARAHGEKVEVLAIAGADAQGETLDRVKAFVEKRRSEIAYAVGFDEGAATRSAWLGAARIARIPTAFVVGPDGRIAWIGDSVRSVKGLETAVTELVEGQFDMTKAVAAAGAEKARRAAAEEAGVEVQIRLRDAVRADDHEGVISSVEALLRLDEQRYGRLAVLGFNAMLNGRRDARGAAAFAREMLSSRLRDDAVALDALAWAVVEGPRTPPCDAGLALELAVRANALAEGEDPRILDTLARVRFVRGEVDEAIRLQGLAAAAASGGPLEAKLRATLSEYERSRGPERGK